MFFLLLFIYLIYLNFYIYIIKLDFILCATAKLTLLFPSNIYIIVYFLKLDSESILFMVLYNIYINFISSFCFYLLSKDLYLYFK